jgi:predicted RNA-binding Zn-ribbon protein involved in translation (DUF1610 family)
MRVLVVVVVLSLSSIGLAQPTVTSAGAGTTAPTSSPPTTTAPAGTMAAAPALGRADAVRARKWNPVLCGCASSRFLARGDVAIDGDSSVSAWLHGGARIEAFTRDAAGTLAATTLPTTSKREPFLVGGDAQTASEGEAGDALVHVFGSGDGRGFLGVVKPRERTPRDVLGVSVTSASDGVADDTRAPVLDALWLAAPERRERRDCGAWSTMRTAFFVREGSVAVEAFDIRDVDTGERRLVDARHVGAFGLGEVPACRHGFALSTSTQTLEVVPVSAAGVRGAPWVLRHDGQGLVDVVRVSSPPEAEAELISLPLPQPGQPLRRFSWLSVGGVWILSAVLGLACGVVGFLFWRFKKRRMHDVRCANCNAAIPLDVLDEKTDGFFCPACGKAGVWKGRRRVDVDVTQL